MSNTEGQKKTFTSYFIPVLTAVIVSALVAGATAIITLHADMGVMREMLRVQNREMQRLEGELERIKSTRFTDRDATNYQTVFDQKIETTNERVSNNRAEIQKLENDFENLCRCD